MSSVGILKSLTAPVVWLLKYIVRGLSITGLGAHVGPRMDDDGGSEVPKATDVPAAAPSEEVASRSVLTYDERLWQAELAGGDSGAHESA